MQTMRKLTWKLLEIWHVKGVNDKHGHQKKWVVDEMTYFLPWMRENKGNRMEKRVVDELTYFLPWKRENKGIRMEGQPIP